MSARGHLWGVWWKLESPSSRRTLQETFQVGRWLRGWVSVVAERSKALLWREKKRIPGSPPPPAWITRPGHWLLNHWKLWNDSCIKRWEYKINHSSGIVLLQICIWGYLFLPIIINFFRWSTSVAQGGICASYRHSGPDQKRQRYRSAGEPVAHSGAEHEWVTLIAINHLYINKGSTNEAIFPH